MTEFKNIISASGIPGLYVIVAQRKDGILARNLADQKVTFIPTRGHNLSLLEAIGIYTVDVDTIPLADVFRNMNQLEQEQNLIPPATGSKDNDLRNYFTQILPKHDPSRVYVSDIKKIIKWYAILKNSNAIPPEPQPETTQMQEALQEHSNDENSENNE